MEKINYVNYIRVINAKLGYGLKEKEITTLGICISLSDVVKEAETMGGAIPFQVAHKLLRDYLKIKERNAAPGQKYPLTDPAQLGKFLEGHGKNTYNLWFKDDANARLYLPLLPLDPMDGMVPIAMPVVGAGPVPIQIRAGTPVERVRFERKNDKGELHFERVNFALNVNPDRIARIERVGRRKLHPTLKPFSILKREANELLYKSP